jgi:enoyl-CoA hydratase/carnithine racemase
MTDELPVAVFLRRLVTGKKPIVAAVAGAAIGIGTTLLLHCDLIYAADSARFQLPFASLGLCPEGGSSVLLPRLVGPAKAAELLLLGEPFDAPNAASLGLVNAVLPAAEVVAHGRDIAQKLASRPPAAIQASRALLRGSPEALLETLNVEFGQFGRLLRGPEAAEAVQAFMQKRAPDFSRF